MTDRLTNYRRERERTDGDDAFYARAQERLDESWPLSWLTSYDGGAGAGGRLGAGRFRFSNGRLDSARAWR